MKLNEVVSVLRAVAPEGLAEEWDRIGVHLAGDGKPIRKAMLCIDLTPAVLDEAVAAKCKLIVAYHPPIFHPLKRLADRDWKERLLAEAVRKGIAVYSPHTALDAVRPGMNDWLCDGLGDAQVRWSIAGAKEGASGHYKVVVFVPRQDADRVRQAMFDAGGGTIGDYFDCSFNLHGTGTFHGSDGTNPAIGKPGQLESVEEARIEMVCSRYSLPYALKACRAAHPYEEPAIDVFQLMREPPVEEQEQASGRVHVLNKPVSARTLIARTKKVLGQSQLKAAVPESYGERGSNLLQTIAVCVGAGGSLFEKYPHADAYLTGEMQHHQVLDLCQKGKVVILAGHTNTERPFLKHYREAILAAGAIGIEWLVSKSDRAPMKIV